MALHSACHRRSGARVVEVSPVQTLPRVLVVDDEEPIRNTLTEALELEGYAVRSASNGAEACERMR